jgi:hypothetical protein
MNATYIFMNILVAKPNVPVMANSIWSLRSTDWNALLCTVLWENKLLKLKTRKHSPVPSGKADLRKIPSWFASEIIGTFMI